MKTVQLIKRPHTVQIGDVCDYIEPNVTEDCLFENEGEIIGFYIKDISTHSEKAAQLAHIANKELRSANVPKTEMSRGPQGSKKDKLERAKNGINLVTQFSTILGGVPPKPHMRRPYPTISSVHSVKTAQTFIKAMLMLCSESENIIRTLTPHIYERQHNIISQNIPKKWRFGNLFTSSISNYNISAPFHRDAGNLEGCVNVIIAKKEYAKGGNTTVPDYGATVDSSDNSMLVYPAWRNVHGVTPIVPLKEGGYRNSLVFYPLKAFKGLE
jgi:hypothetical protein